MRLRQIGDAWSERENKERKRGREREASFFLRCAVTLKDACWLLHCIRGVLMRALQPPFPVTIIKPADRGFKQPFLQATANAEVPLSKTLPAPYACSEGESDL